MYEVSPIAPPVASQQAAGNSTAIRGEHKGTGGSGTGVWGSHAGGGCGVAGNSDSGTGVRGVSTVGVGVSGEGQTGVVATGQIALYAETTYASGYALQARANRPQGIAIYGECTNTTGYAGVFRGNVQVRGHDTEAVLIELGEGLDYAEAFSVSDKQKATPGSVLVIDADNPGKLTLASRPYDCRVAGIAAGAKGLGSAVRLGVGQFDCDVALAGRVYCNVDATETPVEPGDLLTTSSTPGHAMKAADLTRAQGAILGKAMEPLPKGAKGQILVLVTLQ